MVGGGVDGMGTGTRVSRSNVRGMLRPRLALRFVVTRKKKRGDSRRRGEDNAVCSVNRLCHVERVRGPLVGRGWRWERPRVFVAR